MHGLSVHLAIWAAEGRRLRGVVNIPEWFVSREELGKDCLFFLHDVNAFFGYVPVRLFLVGQVYSACRAQGALDYSRRKRKWRQIYFLDAEMPVVGFQTTKSWNWDSYLFQFLLSKQAKMWTMLHFNLNHNCLSGVGAFLISDFFSLIIFRKNSIFNFSKRFRDLYNLMILIITNQTDIFVPPASK